MIDRVHLRSLLQGIYADVSPDTRYTTRESSGFTCLYNKPHPTNPNGPCRCIIGEILHRAGYDVDKLENITVGVAHLRLYVPEKYRFKEDHIPLLSLLQRLQDSGMTWRRSIEIALDTFPLN